MAIEWTSTLFDGEMQSALTTVALMVVSLSTTVSCTRCFLQPSLGGVPNESTSPLLCTLISSSQESNDERSDEDDVSENVFNAGNDVQSGEGLDMEADEREALLRSLREEPGHKFMRFGRGSSSFSSSSSSLDAVRRFIRDPDHKYMRFGRGPEHKFMRFGRGEARHNIMRFGRSVEFNKPQVRMMHSMSSSNSNGNGNANRMAALPLFMRLGRGPEHVFMRFGRQDGGVGGGASHKFMRFGRMTNLESQTDDEAASSAASAVVAASVANSQHVSNEKEMK